MVEPEREFDLRKVLVTVLRPDSEEEHLVVGQMDRTLFVPLDHNDMHLRSSDRLGEWTFEGLFDA